MKKLYLLLVSSLLLVGSAGALTVSVAGCDHKKKDDQTTKVCDALKEFTKTNPIKILYNQANSKALASDPAVTKLIRDQLKSKNPTIFTDDVVKDISFSKTPLQPGTAVEIKAIYKKKPTTIYVQEATNPAQGVYQALATFDQKHPIAILYQTNPTALASSSLVTKAIQSRMKSRNPIFTDDVVKDISFNKTPLQPGTAVEIKAIYKKKPTTIYVKETKNLIYEALAKFDTTTPIAIAYNHKTPTALASNPAVTTAIKSQMKKRDPIFTDQVLAEITFSKTALQPGTAVEIKATYKKKPTAIYVREAANPAQGVYKALATFDQKHPIVILFNEKNPTALASNPAVTTAIKSQMKKRDPIFTDPVLAEITFSKTPLQPGTAVLVQANYDKQETPFYVQEQEGSEAQKVINALKQFNNPATDVQIGAEYDRKHADEYSILGFVTKAGDAIRNYIADYGIDVAKVHDITFNHALLMQEHPVSVIASYKGKSTPILVKLKDKLTPDQRKVKLVLERFNAWHRLKIWDTHHKWVDANEDIGTEKIRNALVKQGKLSRKLANDITFGNDAIVQQGLVPIPSQRWRTIATFRKNLVQVTIYGITNPV